jgi:hypothetical protein
MPSGLKSRDNTISDAGLQYKIFREGFNCPKGMELSMASFLAAMPPTAILRADIVLLSVLLKTRIELRNNLAFCIDS